MFEVTYLTICAVIGGVAGLLVVSQATGVSPQAVVRAIVDFFST